MCKSIDKTVFNYYLINILILQVLGISNIQQQTKDGGRRDVHEK